MIYQNKLNLSTYSRTISQQYGQNSTEQTQSTTIQEKNESNEIYDDNKQDNQNKLIVINEITMKFIST